uniref:Uncharacterized protein n=1 Tax=Panagrellus redivivus TaxID=6233 RepID=A0A7E4WBN0_PANRE
MASYGARGGSCELALQNRHMNDGPCACSAVPAQWRSTGLDPQADLGAMGPDTSGVRVLKTAVAPLATRLAAILIRDFEKRRQLLMRSCLRFFPGNSVLDMFPAASSMRSAFSLPSATRLAAIFALSSAQPAKGSSAFKHPSASVESHQLLSSILCILELVAILAVWSANSASGYPGFLRFGFFEHVSSGKSSVNRAISLFAPQLLPYSANKRLSPRWRVVFGPSSRVSSSVPSMPNRFNLFTFTPLGIGVGIPFEF